MVKNHSPNRRGNGKTFWRRSGSESIHLHRGLRQTEQKNKEIFKENQTGLLQPHFKTHRCMMVKLKMISGPFQAILFTVITWKPRVKLYITKAESFSFSTETHRRDQNNMYITGCIVGEIDDCWNVGGEKELSDAWTGFERFILMNERPLDGYTWSGWILTRKQTTSRPDNVWSDMRKRMSDVAKKNAKQKKGSRLTKTILPDNDGVSFSLNQMMKNLNIP